MFDLAFAKVEVEVMGTVGNPERKVSRFLPRCAILAEVCNTWDANSK